MSASAEQASRITAPADAAPDGLAGLPAGEPVDGASPGSVLAQAGIGPVDYSERHPLTFDQWLARGIDAYNLGEELERTEGLSPNAIAAYREASVSLNAATWEAPEDQLKDPVRTLMIAGSLAKQAQAEEVAPYQGQQYDWDGNPIDIDRRGNLKRISNELLVHAGALIWGQDEEVKLQLGGDEAEPVPPSEVVKFAAGQVAEATGVDMDPYLEAVTDEVTHATEENTAVIELRPELVAKTAEIAVSELLAAREVPIAA